MEPSELDKNLAELEEKIDRVRALYEQYFVGVEKLEPQIPRKDVERLIVVMRKEQIRNTASRFKFQTLVQRFNTMQQHWARTMREIENGTFRRDVLKAAARFGAEDALTAVGRKQAQKLKKVIEAQQERLGSRQASKKSSSGSSATSTSGSKEEVYEDVNTSDVMLVDDFDDDAPTPPPVHVNAPDQAYGSSPGYAPSPGSGYGATDGYAAPVGYEAPQRQGSQSGYGQPQRGYAEQGHQQHQPNPSAYAQPNQSRPVAPQASSSQGFAPDPMAYLDDVNDGGTQGGTSASAPDPVKKKGGLRWGGQGGRRADPEALKRMASLAGDEGSGAAAADPAPAPPQNPPGRKPLLSRPLDLGLPEPEVLSVERPPPSVQTAARQQPPPPSPRRPLLSGPLDLDLGSASERPPPPSRAVASPQAAPSATAQAAMRGPGPPHPAASSPPSAPAPTASGPASAGTVPSERSAARPQLRPPPPAGESNSGMAQRAVRAQQPEFGELNEGRLREIYGQYVQTRRERNESTAGITFEKLADSLRSQADKLKGKHVSKRVDYEVVVKDGKTLIKPIVK